MGSFLKFRGKTVFRLLLVLLNMAHRFDSIDKRIIYRLTQDARGTSAPEIAEEVNVSPGTIRNRIQKLEDEGIIQGYHADIDYEKIGKGLINLFKCSSGARERHTLSKKALQVPGVVNIREIMSGEEDLHIKAVGEDMEDITRIASDLTNLGIEIKDEDLIRREYFRPYHLFGPEGEEFEPIIDLRSISGGAEAADLTVAEGVPVAGKTVQEINDLGLLGEDALLISIERGEKTITPHGDSSISPGDIVTIFSPSGLSKETLQSFTEENVETMGEKG